MIENFLNNEILNLTETHPTMITCIVYNYDIQTLINELYERLETIRNIKHPKIKKISNDRIYSLIQYIDKWEKENKLNHIFLINEEIHEYKLSKKNIGTLKEFGMKNQIIYFEEKFKIEYLLDFFTNFNYYDVFECKKLQVNHINLTKTKSKIVKTSTCKNNEELSAFIADNKSNKLSPSIIHGESTLLKNIQLKHSVFNKRLRQEEIIDEFEKNEIIENHKKLEKVFDLLDDERKLHLLIYGKIKNEIKDAIEQYRVKELYCHVDRVSIVKRQLPSEYYNFPIILIKKLKDGDISDKLLNDFRGVIGISYY